MKTDSAPMYDLEKRLLGYGTRIIRHTRKLRHDYAERHIGNQLLRSETAPLAHHGEAQAAESDAALLIDETDQLIRIFVTSLATAEERRA